MGDETDSPGLVIEWRKRGADWWALVTYVVDEDGSPVVVTQWVSASLLSPVRKECPDGRTPVAGLSGKAGTPRV